MPIKDYPNITTLADNDLLLVQTASDDAFKNIKASDLRACLGSGIITGGHQLDYVADGDTNDVFSYIGTLGNTKPWVNPSTTGLVLAASGTEHGSLSELVDRVGSEYWSPSVANSWVSFFLGSSKLVCNHYSIKSRLANSDYYPRNWILQGSNDGSTWIDLDNQINNTTLNSVNQWLSLPVVTSISYSWFRLLQNGIDSSGVGYFCLGEVKLYGFLTP